MALVRLFVFGFILLTVVYVIVSIYSRSVRREKLEKAWDTDPAREGAPEGERRAFIDEGMKKYEKGLRKRLIWLVYIIPMAALALTIYYINVQ